MSFGNVPVDAGSVPIAETYVHGVGFVALQGSTNTDTDGSSNKSTPANFNLTQINSLAVNMAGTDGDTATSILEVVPGLYNGATVDQQRGNLDNITLLAFGAVSANSHSTDQINYNARGIKLYVVTGTFGSGASGLSVTLRGKDPASSNYFTILQSASLSASTFLVLSVYPGLTASANVVANDVLPRTWRVEYGATAWGTGGSQLGLFCSLIV